MTKSKKVPQRSISRKVQAILTGTAILFQLALPVFSFATTPVTLFSDGFESNDFSHWTSADNTGSAGKWDVLGGDVHAGSKKAEMKGSTSSDMSIAKTQSTAGYENIVLSYWYKVVSGKELESNDHLYVEWSVNGTGWTQLTDYSAAPSSSSWTQASFSLPAGTANQSGFRFRFRANMDSANDLVRFDDVALTGTAIVTPPPAVTGSISGMKFGDANANGVQDNGEAGLSGWTITLSGPASASAVTNAGGNYSFASLADGTYTVCETMQSGWSQTFPASGAACTGGFGYSVTISGGNTVSGENFGNVQHGHLIVTKVTDPANDAQQFSITATGDGTVFSNATQNISALSPVNYEVNPGTYSVSEAAVSGWSNTGNTCVNITVAAGATATCTITNTKFGSISVIKIADPAQGTFGFTLTGGDYSQTQSVTIGQNSNTTVFSSLMPGAYTLTESSVPEDWTNASMTTNCGGTITLSAGGSVTCTINNTQYAVITGKKFNDLNANGVNDSEPALSAWTMTLTGTDENQNPVNSSVQTDENGNYSFTSLMPGTYTVCEQMQEGWHQSAPASGADCQGSNGYTVTVTAGATAGNNDFGNFQDNDAPVSSFNDPLDHKVINTEIVSLNLSGTSADQVSGVQTLELTVAEIGGPDSVAQYPSSSFFDVFTPLDCATAQPVATELVSLTLTNGAWSHDWTPAESGLYCFSLKATDKVGNVETSVFAGPVAYVPVVQISNQNAGTPGETSFTVTWDTDKPATSRVVFDTVPHATLGTQPNYGYALSSVESDVDPTVINHSVTLSGLTSGTTYYYRVISHASPESVSSEGSFTTATPAPAPAPEQPPVNTDNTSGSGGTSSSGGSGSSGGGGNATNDPSVNNDPGSFIPGCSPSGCTLATQGGNSNQETPAPNPTLALANTSGPVTGGNEVGNSGENAAPSNEVAAAPAGNEAPAAEQPAAQNPGLLAALGSLIGFGGSPWSSLLFWIVVLLAIYLTYRQFRKKNNQ